jgi:hypothetical protein
MGLVSLISRLKDASGNLKFSTGFDFWHLALADSNRPRAGGVVCSKVIDISPCLKAVVVVGAVETVENSIK